MPVEDFNVVPFWNPGSYHHNWGRERYGVPESDSMQGYFTYFRASLIVYS